MKDYDFFAHECHIVLLSKSSCKMCALLFLCRDPFTDNCNFSQCISNVFNLIFFS